MLERITVMHVAHNADPVARCGIWRTTLGVKGTWYTLQLAYSCAGHEDNAYLREYLKPLNRSKFYGHFKASIIEVVAIAVFTIIILFLISHNQPEQKQTIDTSHTPKLQNNIL